MSQNKIFDCEQAHRNVRDFYDQRNNQAREINRLDEVLSQRSKLAIAEDELSRVESALQDLAEGATSLGLNILRGNRH